MVSFTRSVAKTVPPTTSPLSSSLKKLTRTCSSASPICVSKFSVTPESPALELPDLDTTPGLGESSAPSAPLTTPETPIKKSVHCVSVTSDTARELPDLVTPAHESSAPVTPSVPLTTPEIPDLTTPALEPSASAAAETPVKKSVRFGSVTIHLLPPSAPVPPKTPIRKSVDFSHITTHLPREQDWYDESDKNNMFYSKSKKKHMHRMVRRDADLVTHCDKVYCNSQGHCRQRNTAFVPSLKRIYASCCFEEEDDCSSSHSDLEILTRKYAESSHRGLERALLGSKVYKKRKRIIKIAVFMFKITKAIQGHVRASRYMAEFCATKAAPSKRFALIMGRVDELSLAHVVVPVEEETQSPRVKTVQLPSSKNVAGFFSPTKVFKRIAPMVSQRTEPPPLLVMSGELA